MGRCRGQGTEEWTGRGRVARERGGKGMGREEGEEGREALSVNSCIRPWDVNGWPTYHMA